MAGILLTEIIVAVLCWAVILDCVLDPFYTWKGDQERFVWAGGFLLLWLGASVGLYLILASLA